MFEPEMVKCEGCGDPFVTREAFEKVRAALERGSDDGAKVEMRLRHSRFCPGCKDEVVMRDTFGASEFSHYRSRPNEQ